MAYRARPQRPKVELHAWCVELPQKNGGWIIAVDANGPMVRFSLMSARAARAELVHHQDAIGRRPFVRARVRRVMLMAWGCAV
jgi:hypothetical protein